MYANLLINEPIEKVIEDWDYLQDKIISRLATFKEVGQNIYGVRKMGIRSGPAPIRPSSPSVSNYLEKAGTQRGTYVMGPSGVELKQGDDLLLVVTPGGHPHHVTHSFGYWHINDMDELSIRIPGPAPDQPGFNLLIMGVPGPGETDRWAWYCEECLTLLYECKWETGLKGFNGFWKAEATAVAEYNKEPRNQVCPDCGHPNPKGYTWNPAKDGPEERAARQLW